VLTNKEIKQRIESFSQWHYQFNLRGHRTPIVNEKSIPRHRQRKSYFFDPLVQFSGGSLAGKRVLDLGCSAGFWSLCAIEGGADFVLGIDGRQMHVDQANFVFEVKEVDTSRYSFLAENIFSLDFSQFGDFDIVLCLGLMYHINKHVPLMEQISRVNSDVLVIDSTLSTVSGSYMEIRHERTDEPRNSVDYELAMVPTEEAVHDLARPFGYSTATLTPRFRNAKGMNDYRGSQDYREGSRRAFFCAKSTDISSLQVGIDRFSPSPKTVTGDSAQNALGKEDSRS
jgi:2-polyprenyl-3-methyl-5-hydroxy-6-metoxy-1,4-benzoquinol methylase